MNEDVFIKQEADELTNRIADRLGERQQKLERMAEWERLDKKSTHIRPLFMTLAIAACIAALFFFSPFGQSGQSYLDDLGIASPSLTDFRAGSPELTEISNLMEKEDFDNALEKAEAALARSEEALKMYYETEELWGDDEAIKYDKELEWEVNSELRWVYIYLLVKQGHKKDAKKELKRYLKYPDYCEHEAEAKALLEKL